MKFDFGKHMWDSQTGLRKLTQEVMDGAICKGILKKQGANWKTWRTRYFILTENVLFYLSSPKNTVPKGAILLSHTLIEGADETVDRPWCFLVKAKKSYTGTKQWSGRTYYLQATDYADMNRWIQAVLSNPVRLSQKITYSNLAAFERQGESTTSSRANTASSESSAKGARKSRSSSVNENSSPPVNSNSHSGTDSHPKREASHKEEETPGENANIVEGLRLSECYTLDSPSYMMQNYTTFSSSDESDCEDTDGSYSAVEAPINVKGMPFGLDVQKDYN